MANPQTTPDPCPTCGALPCDQTKRPPSVEEFMEKQLADPEIKAVYERLAKR